MAYQYKIAGHVYIFDVDYGEEAEVARIIVRSAEGGSEGLFLVDRSGDVESADDLPGFGPNPAARDGIWPDPPHELIRDAQRIALQKMPKDDARTPAGTPAGTPRCVSSAAGGSGEVAAAAGPVRASARRAFSVGDK